MHRVSDHLQHRHPYCDPPFRESADPTEVARAFGSQALAKYAQLLETDELADDDRCRALRELRELLSNQETKYAAIIKELALLCVNLTDAPAAAVRAEAALVMASLVLGQPGERNELITEMTLSAAAKLLGDEEEAAVVAGATVLRNLTLSMDGALLVAGKPELVATLAALLTERPLRLVPRQVLELLLAVLANVTRVHEGERSVAAHAIFPSLLSVLKKPLLFRPETVLHGALVVANAAAHGHGKQDAISAGAVEVCLRALSKSLDGALASGAATHSDDLTRALVGAVMGLSTAEKAKPQVIEFGGEPLAKCLRHASPAVRRNAAIAVNSACEAPGGTTHFVQRLLRDSQLIVEVLGPKAVPALFKSATSVDDDEALAALVAIRALLAASADGAAAEQVVQTLGLLGALAERALELDAAPEDEEAAKSKREQRAVAIEILRGMSAAGDAHCRRVGKLLRKRGADEQSFSLLTGLAPADFDRRFA